MADNSEVSRNSLIIIKIIDSMLGSKATTVIISERIFPLYMTLDIKQLILREY